MRPGEVRPHCNPAVGSIARRTRRLESDCEISRASWKAGIEGQPSETWTCQLPEYPYPTNQRAESTAIVTALEQALQKYDSLGANPNLDITVMSDSKYVIGCVDNWIYKWSRNGWINAAGNKVANQGLIKKASDLDDELKRRGIVAYKWIPRAYRGSAIGLLRRVPGCGSFWGRYPFRSVLMKNGMVEVDDSGHDGTIRMVVRENQNVLRLDITMDDTSLMKASNSTSDPKAEFQLDYER